MVNVTETSCLETPETCPAKTVGPLAQPQQAFHGPIAWSPDSRSIVVPDGWSGLDNNLQIIDVVRNRRRTLVEDIKAPGGIVWLPSDRIIYTQESDIWIISPQGGEPKLLARLDDALIGWVLVMNPMQISATYVITEAGMDLHLRRLPTLDGDILKRFQAGEQVQILDGPVEAQGYTWWKMRSVADGVEGWAVEHPDWYKPVNP